MVKSQKQILSKETWKVLGEKKEIKKNGILKKTRILKYVKCQWEEMIHIKKSG